MVTALAAHIYSDPIDGLLLFPTTGCPSESCPNCTDCTNGCDTCPACTADDPLKACEHCLPPNLTARTAHTLAFAGHVLADDCYDAITESWAGRGDLPLPHCMTNQTDDFIRRLARRFDDLVHDLHAPELHNLAEQLALHLMINRAEDLHTDQPEPLDDRSLLPTSRHDYTFDTLFDVLLRRRRPHRLPQTPRTRRTRHPRLPLRPLPARPRPRPPPRLPPLTPLGRPHPAGISPHASNLPHRQQTPMATNTHVTGRPEVPANNHLGGRHNG